MKLGLFPTAQITTWKPEGKKYKANTALALELENSTPQMRLNPTTDKEVRYLTASTTSLVVSSTFVMPAYTPERNTQRADSVYTPPMVKSWIVLMVGLLVSSVAWADAPEWLPNNFPPGAKGFWWGESKESAATKCKSFISKAKDSVALCQTEASEDIVLGFTKNKLTLIAWDISLQEYDRCVSDVLRAVGASGRSEHRGMDTWGFYYAPEGRRVGDVSCRKPFKDCDKQGCTPILIFFK